MFSIESHLCAHGGGWGLGMIDDSAYRLKWTVLRGAVAGFLVFFMSRCTFCWECFFFSSFFSFFVQVRVHMVGGRRGGV